MNETRIKIYLLIAILVIASILFFFSELGVPMIKKRADLWMCQSNLRKLGVAMQKYAADNNGMYPTPSKWCDLLLEKTSIKKDEFCCGSAGDSVFDTNAPIEETNIPPKVIFLRDYNEAGRKKYVYLIKGSNYALNPNAEPNSPPDTVLLFETKMGWNQFGGPELVSVKHHLFIYEKEGCNILFNDGSVKFIKPQDVSKLNWGKDSRVPK